VVAVELNTGEADGASLTFNVVELTLTSDTAESAPDGTADSRTTIGLGEQVECTVTDNPPDVGPQPTWQAIGGGSVDPQTTTTTTFTAPKGPATCTVQVTVDQATASLDFQVIEPNGLNAAFVRDGGQGIPGDLWIACQSFFGTTVVPTSVSFHNVEFREHVLPSKWQWPDGTPDNFPEGWVPWNVDLGNLTFDNCAWWDRRVIWLDGNPLATACSIDEQYRNEAGGWTVWLPGEAHPFKCEANGSSRAGIQPGAGQGAWGGWQGPWQRWELEE
jgi:hypothetical protein